MAANIGSSLTPMGNPQNLTIFYHYDLNFMQFIIIIAPITLVGLLLLIINSLLFKNQKLDFNITEATISNKRKLIIYLILFCLILLTVVHVLNQNLVLLIVLISVMLLDRHLFKRVDYALLLTFIFFFIIVGNIYHLVEFKRLLETYLQSETQVYFNSIILSQIISNVPAAILISNFTTHYQALIYGVNIGGLGTLIASLASVISYKLYIKEFNGKNYLKIFTLYNLFYLIILTIWGLIMLKYF